MSIPIVSILEHKGREVVTVTPDATLADAARALSEHNIGAVIVTPDQRTVAGILSERDVVRRLADGGPDVLARPVSEYMSHDVTTCDLHVTTDQLMETMTARRIRHLPVVEEDRLEAIISIGDVVKAYIEDLEVERESLEQYASGSSY